MIATARLSHPAGRGWWSAALAAVIGLASLSNAPVRAVDPLDPVVGDPGVTLPNLVPDVREVSILRRFVFDEPSRTYVPGPPELWLDTSTSNLGAAPLRLTVDDVSKPESSTVSQCVSWREDLLCREQRQVDGISWDASNYTFRFNVFATYQLRRFLRNGEVDYSRRGLGATVDKISACITDHTRAREDASLAPVYPKCELYGQGLSPGWADVDTGAEPYQQLSLDGLSDGRYAVVVTVDPAGRVHESADTDNTVEVAVELSGGLTQATIVDRGTSGEGSL